MATRMSSRRVVERRSELEALVAGLEDAIAGRPSVTVILGEAGVGKTRLLRELEGAAVEPGFTVLRGACFRLEGGELPYAPLDAALSDVPAAALGRAAATLPPGARDELARTFPALWPVVESPGASVDEDARTTLYRALLGLLDALGRESPVLLAIEDFQWVDRATRDLVRVLVHDRRRERLACVITHRTEDLPRDHPVERMVDELTALDSVTEIRLRGLSPEGLSSQVADILGEAPPRGLVDALHRRSRGNPFFAEELLAAYREGRVDEIPQKINRAALPRLRSVSETAQHVLATMAVIARPASHDVLAETTGVDARVIDDALREAMQHSLIVPVADRARVAFRHELVREAAYCALMPGERTELHLAVARGLSRCPNDAGHAELAHHWRAAGRSEEALQASLAAALEAQAAHAFADAVRHLDTARTLWDEAGATATERSLTMIDVLGHLADALKHCGDYDRAAALCREALAGLGDDGDRVQVALFHERLGRLQSSKSQEALASYRAALRHVPPDRRVLRARLLSEEADALAGLLDYEAARVLCEEALRLAEEEGAVEETAYARTVLGLTVAYAGDPPSGEAHLRAALDLPPDEIPPDRRLIAHLYLGEVLRLDGRYEAAHAAMREGSRLAHDLGMEGSFGWFMTLNAALDLFCLGRWDEADALVGDLRDKPLQQWSEILLRQAAAQLRLARGDLAQAQLELEAAQRVCANAPPDCMPDVYATFAELRLVQRAHGDARRLIREALDAVHDALDLLYGPALFSMGARVEADAAESARDGRAAEAVAAAHASAMGLLSELEALLDRDADARVPPTARAHLLTCRAEVARAGVARRAVEDDETSGTTAERAEEAWTAASDAWDAVSFPYLGAYARRRLAEFALASGRHRVASQALRDAHVLARSLGAELLARDVELLARRSRISLDAPTGAPGPERQPGSAFHPLTTRELDVLMLLAEGRTDREIAARLFITQKTASHHVSHILAKLSVRTRNEAAAWAHRQGILDLDPGGAAVTR